MHKHIEWGQTLPRPKWWHKFLPRSKRPKPTHQKGVATTYNDDGSFTIEGFIRQLDSNHIYDDLAINFAADNEEEKHD